ncbi:MAG: hypothetical protein C0610_04155 [Desulfobacteraceae bacterium]|nr:MAG: hypothetical protein C0610_04155 [Desulfobacteraceae bacterium]
MIALRTWTYLLIWSTLRGLALRNSTRFFQDDLDLIRANIAPKTKGQVQMAQEKCPRTRFPVSRRHNGGGQFGETGELRKPPLRFESDNSKGIA